MAVQERHAGSRLDQRKKEREAKELMAAEMAVKEESQATEAAAKSAKEAALRERQRSAIATPGARTPASTPRRKAFGL